MSVDIREVIKGASFVSTLTWEARFIETREELKEVVQRIRSAGLTIVLTMGTWDMLHIGHDRYMREARMRGDILIVGADDDKKAQVRKGENRPVVPQDERLEMLCHQRYVDLVILKSIDDAQWLLIKTVRPDILIAVEGTYTPEQISEIAAFCGEVVVLPRQAETSTSAKIRRLVCDGADIFMRLLMPGVEALIRKTYERVKNGEGV